MGSNPIGGIYFLKYNLIFIGKDSSFYMKTLRDLQKLMLEGTELETEDLREYTEKIGSVVNELAEKIGSVVNELVAQTGASPIELIVSGYLGSMNNSDLPAEKFAIPGHFVLVYASTLNKRGFISIGDYSDLALFYKVYSVLENEENKDLSAKEIYSKLAHKSI